jgi:hypothetical protein
MEYSLNRGPNCVPNLMVPSLDSGALKPEKTFHGDEWLAMVIPTVQ